MSLLTSNDRHDLYGHIKKIDHTFNMLDDDIQSLLSAIETKIEEVIHREEILKASKSITISFNGEPGSGKSILMDAIKQKEFPGFVIVHINDAGHEISYAKICESCRRLI